MKDQQLYSLVERAAVQDSDAFMELCEYKARDILYICIKRMGNRPDGEDAAQEVFIRMQKSIGGLNSPEAFGVWLNRIITTTCQNQRRGLANRLPPLQLDEFTDLLKENKMEFLPPEYAEEKDKQQLVLSCLHNLPPRYQEVLHFFYYEELSLEEIALVLGVSKSSVDHRLRRARQAVKRQLEKRGTPSMHSFAPVAGALPVMRRILMLEAHTLVNEEMVQRSLSELGTAVAGGGIAGAAASVAAGAGTAGAAAGSAAGAIAATGGVASALILPIVSAAAILTLGGGLLVGTFQSAEANSTPPEDSYLAQEADIFDPPPESAASLPAPAPVVNDLPVTGRVVLLGAGGEIGHYGARQTVQLWMEDKMVDTAQTDGEGHFSLTAPGPGNYRIVLANPPSGLAFAADNPDGTLAFTLEEQDTAVQVQVLYLTDTQAPTGYIELVGDELFNPGGAVLQVADATSTTVRWHITQRGGGEPVASGTGNTVGPEQLQLPASHDGVWYTVTFQATDACGNTGTFSRDFILIL